MVDPHHVAHWYPTAAYLYVLWLDALALAWEYLRRHPDYRLDWLRHRRRPRAAQQAAQRAARQGFVVDDHDPHGSPSRTRLATTFLSSVVFPTSLRSKW